ncbi:MAG: triose-phosphate isomerase [Armatimonadota bacterium]
MYFLDPKTGLLSIRADYKLEDVSDPNLLREMFPYTQVPRTLFDHYHVPMNCPKDIFITDTTFRDGQQARPPYTVEQTVTLFDMLHRLGGPNGVIRASEFFLYSAKDRLAVEKCLERGYEFPKVTGWIRANKRDFELVRQMGLKETGILTSASDYHIFHKFGKTREQMMDSYLGLVSGALESGLDAVRCHLEDITRADFYGFIVPFVQKLMALAHDSGKIIKIRMCDTMGYGLPYAEAALPRSVPKMVHALIYEGGVPSEWLEWHGHNDFHKVLINAQAAWLYGCCAANGTFLGYGERTGNPPIEALVMEYISLRGDTNGIDTRVITEMADYYKHEIKAEVPAGYPFVGDNFNTTSAGIHSDGVLKDEEIYNIFDTSTILNRPVGVNVTDKSGIAGISHWVNTFLGLKGDNRVDKRHSGLAAIGEWVEQQYNDGRITSISNEEMLVQARIHLPEHFKSDFDRLRDRAMNLSEKVVLDLVLRSELLQMNVEPIERLLEEALRQHKFIQFAYVVDMNGNKITKNITQAEYRDKFESIRLDDNFSDRDWFINALKHKDVFVSDFYKSRITGALCLTVSAPIHDSATNEIKGVLGADLRFEDLARMESLSLYA